VGSNTVLSIGTVVELQLKARIIGAFYGTILMNIHRWNTVKSSFCHMPRYHLETSWTRNGIIILNSLRHSILYKSTNEYVLCRWSKSEWVEVISLDLCTVWYHRLPLDHCDQTCTQRPQHTVTTDSVKPSNKSVPWKMQSTSFNTRLSEDDTAARLREKSIIAGSSAEI